MKRLPVKFEYDREVDAAYLTLARRKIAMTRRVQPGIMVDLDGNNEIVGVEILNFGRRFAKREKQTAATIAD